MEIVDNPEVVKLTLDHLVSKYHLNEKRDTIHLSSVVTCLTSSFFGMCEDSIRPTDAELLLFALGYGLQDVITPPNASAPTIILEGISYRPDYMLKIKKSRLYEIKTTRMSAKKGEEHDFPQAWLEYMMGGCFMMEKNEYELAVIYMMGTWRPPFPMLSGYRFVFDDDELFDNWSWITQRKEVLQTCIDRRVIPTPFQWNKDYECEHCRYKLVCDAMSFAPNEFSPKLVK